ncbi:MAG: toll/interleukin-1 receptor domain-containing protein [Anaerolineae bacterium]|nr:toll/interleukin-1 receptor domain-containing protein [Anaerolineae bacterium]
MARIFISYRRDDSRETALQLLAALKPHFIVFMDVEGILVGKDFRATVERELLAAQVVLIVIGTQWVTITGKDGSRRLDKLDDLVRIEAEMALRHDKIVIPVLVNGATMPTADELPRSLSQLPFL